MLIRDARDDDSLDLIGLVARCWAGYPGCVLDVYGEEPDLLSPGSALRPGHWWVAEEAARVVGSVALVPGEGATVLLKKLYVDPTMRRRGLGRQLVETVEAEAVERGATRIELWTDTRFEDAHRLYLRLGYEQAVTPAPNGPGKPEPETRELHDLSHTVEYRFFKTLDHN